MKPTTNAIHHLVLLTPLTPRPPLNSIVPLLLLMFWKFQRTYRSPCMCRTICFLSMHCNELSKHRNLIIRDCAESPLWWKYLLRLDELLELAMQ